MFERMADRRRCVEFVRSAKEAAKRFNDDLAGGTAPAVPARETNSERSLIGSGEWPSTAVAAATGPSKASFGLPTAGREGPLTPFGKDDSDDSGALLLEARRRLSMIASLCSRIALLDEELADLGFSVA